MDALLRREGVVASRLEAWRSADRRGELAPPRRRAPGRPGPEAGTGRSDARDRRIIELERENRRLKACEEALAELQRKVSGLLGIPLERARG